MRCDLQTWLYGLAAAFELGGIVLAGNEIRRSHRALVTFVDVNDRLQHASGYGPHPLVKAAVEELLGGRWRRMLSIFLLGVGVLIGLAGNLIGQ